MTFDVRAITAPTTAIARLRTAAPAAAFIAITITATTTTITPPEAGLD